jgi:hypothetical protein
VRLRLDSRALRLALRESLCLATARKVRAETEAARAAARMRRSVSAASPWSRLLWVRADDALDRVLVPLD